MNGRVEYELHEELKERVRELLGPGRYARAYMAHVLDPRVPEPKRPKGMSGIVGVLVRDCVEDVAAGCASSLPPSPPMGLPHV